MTTQNEYTPKLEMDRTTVDGLISSQLKLLFFNLCVSVRREAVDFIQGRDLKNYDCLEY